ncbi:MAG TPA: hypothetical protein VIX20_03575 [Ktedonobacteraceae bacterium]
MLDSEFGQSVTMDFAPEDFYSLLRVSLFVENTAHIPLIFPGISKPNH